MINSKSVPSPSLFMVMISRFNSKTEMPVPSKATLDGSFCDLKRKKTEEDMMLSYLIQIYKRALCSDGNVREKEFLSPSAAVGSQELNISIGDVTAMIQSIKKMSMGKCGR